MDIKAELKHLMNEKKYSFSNVAKATGLSATVINMWLNNNYIGNNDKVADAINNFIQREKERNFKSFIPYVETSIVKYIHEVAKLCHTNGEIGVCYGESGLGKTIAVKEYAKQYSDSILIETDPGYNSKSLLCEMHKRLGLSAEGTSYELMDEVVRKLSNSGRLLIIDEAENLPYKGLEVLRRIHDKTGVGMLLVGMPALVENLRGSQNQYRQLYSRVGFSKSLDKLLLIDISNILRAVDENQRLCPSFLTYSKGNTRTLTKLILRAPSVAKYNKKDALDAEILKQTSKLIMV